MNDHQSPFITITGNIGCGKSTLLTRLKENFPIVVVPEPIEDWGDWLRMFYLNPDKSALGLQVKILTSFKEILDKHKDEGIPVIVERSPIEGIEVFAKTLLDSNVLSGMDIDLLHELLKYCGWAPRVYIYLQTTPSKCMERIHSRNRGVESNISEDYVAKLHEKYEDLFIGESLFRSDHVFIIDADDTQETVYHKVAAMLVENNWFEPSSGNRPVTPVLQVQNNGFH